MKSSRGQILLQVLVMSAVFLSICMAISQLLLQEKTQLKKSVRKEEAVAALEGFNARIWGCLADAGYPPPGTCRPAASQQSCSPDGAGLVFSGTYPDCRILITVDR